MSKWKSVSLKELTNPIKTWTPSADFQYIDLSAIDQETKRVLGAKFTKWEAAPSRARQLIEEGDVLVSTVRPNLNGVAKVGAEYHDATASTGFCVIRPNSQLLDNSFLFHWVKSRPFVSEMVRQATGASYPAVSDRIVLGSTIPLPPLAEQRRIAAILDKADALRVKRREMLRGLEALTKSLFSDKFGEASRNPMHWPQCALGSLIDLGPQNGLYKPSSDYGSGTPILRIDAFYDGKVTDMERLKRVRTVQNEAVAFGLRENDIVINRVNSIEYLGKSALIPQLQEPLVFESNMMRFSVNPALAEPRYVVEFLQTTFIKSQIRAASKDAVNQSSINQQDVKSFLINLPPPHLQHEFVTAVQSIDDLKHWIQESLIGLDAFFASLQHRAFTGTL